MSVDVLSQLECPFAVQNQSVNSKYNLISVWFAGGSRSPWTAASRPSHRRSLPWTLLLPRWSPSPRVSCVMCSAVFFMDIIFITLFTYDDSVIIVTLTSCQLICAVLFYFILYQGHSLSFFSLPLPRWSPSPRVSCVYFFNDFKLHMIVCLLV